MLKNFLGAFSGFFSFLDKVLTNPHKDLFMVRLGSSLLLKKYGAIGPMGNALMPIVAGLTGLLVGSGIYVIDLTLDAYKEAFTLDEFKEKAKEAYEHATKKVYTEEEKDAIRKQYLDIIRKFGQL